MAQEVRRGVRAGPNASATPSTETVPVRHQVGAAERAKRLGHAGAVV